MTNRSDRIKARLDAKKTSVTEDAAGDVLRATVAKHKLKHMEGKKKSPALIAKLTARVAAGKRYQTEEAIKKAVKPAPKPVKPLTNNPGYGYHGIADRKHKGDANKAHAAYNAMHAKVKNWAGEAGHLAVSKKPNEMVRDYLDSKRGRHLEGLEADEKYIKKDFGHFSRSYDPKLFVESVDLNEGKTKATHGVFTVWHSGDYKGMVIHHGGNSSNVARVEALAAKLNGQVEDFNKRSKEKSNYHHEVRPLGRKTVTEQAGDPGDDDHSGVYEVQQRDGRYKNVRIKRQPDGKYHIHHADGSKGSTDLNGVKSYISRNGAAWMKEERMESHGNFKVGDIVTHEDSAPMHIHSINQFKGSKEPQALLGYKPAGKGRGIRHAFVSSLRHHTVNEAKSAYRREYDAYKKERNVKTYDEFTKRAHDFAKQRSKQPVDIDFEPRDNTTVSWAKPKGSPHKIMLGIFSHSVADHNKGTGHHALPKHKVVAPGDFSGRDLFEETLDEAAKKNLIRSLVDSSIDSKSAATKK